VFGRHRVIAIGGLFRRFAPGLAIPCAVAFAVASSAQMPTDPPSSASVLAAAFANRYEVDAISRIELVMRNGSGEERRRKVHYITKMIDQRIHSIARLTAPEYLRGMTILTIEQRNRSNDAFVFLPSLGKTRRVNDRAEGRRVLRERSDL